ncbi:MAG: FAD-dependent oxidoreductase [Thermofilum sp.]
MTRILIVGGGFGGYYAAKTLSSELGDKGEIILVDKSDRFAYLPSLPYILSGKKKVEEISESYQAIARRLRVTFIRGEASLVDIERRKLVLADGREEEYDYLVLAAGATTEYYGIPGSELAVPAWRLEDYLRMIDVLRKNPDRLCVAGGGLTGVEVAGELVEVYGPGKVTLIEKMPNLLPTLNNLKASEVAEKFLSSRGANIVKGKGVVKVAEGEVHVEGGEKIPCDLIIWSLGVRASPIELTGKVERVGRGRWIVVKPNLQIPGYDNVYVVGDLNHFAFDTDCAMKMAEEAILQGKTAAKNIALQVKGGKPVLTHKPIFLASRPKSLVSLGFDKAILVWEKRVSFGKTPYVTKMMIESFVMRDIKGKIAGSFLTTMESRLLKAIS